MSMYQVDPPVKIAKPIDLPSCMYKVDSYHDTKPDNADQEESSAKGLVELEERQLKLVQDLQILENKVQQIAQDHDIFQPNKQEFAKDMMQIEQRQLKLLEDLQVLDVKIQQIAQKCNLQIEPDLQTSGPTNLVITFSPDSIPLSAIILQRMLSNSGQPCILSTHVHSSFSESINEKLSTWLRSHSSGIYTQRKGLVFSLIVKSADAPSLTVNTVSHTAIIGDGNIARYISRAYFSSLYEDFDAITSTEIDTIIDMTENCLIRGDNRERSAVLRTCNAKIGKNSYLVGDHLSLADVVLYSAIILTDTTKSLPSNLQRWFKLCSADDAFNLLNNIV